MKAVFALLITACLALATFGQIIRTESVTVEGLPGLKLTTARAVFYVLKGDWNGKPVMAFPVVHQHSVSFCTGVLMVGQDVIGYKSPNNPKDDFSYTRAEALQFQMKMWRALAKNMWMRIEFKVKSRDYTFTPLAENPMPMIEQDFPLILEWAEKAWGDFQGTIKKFDVERAKAEIIAEAAKPVRPKEKLSIEQRYDKFKDQTTHFTSGVKFTGSLYEISVTPAVSIPSNAKASIESVSLIFTVSADYASRFKAWRGAGLIFLIDGERLKVPEAKYLDSDVTRDASIESQLGCSLSVSEFTKIANGKDVEFQLGYFEHRFQPEHLALFREFLAKVRK